MLLKTGTITALLFLSLKVFSQPYLVRDQTVIVKESSNSLSLAWLGGLNNPQFSAFDFNSDNKQDLFIFDKSGGVIVPLVQNGSPGEQKFTFEDEYIKHFPKSRDWVLLRDFNCDGYPDLFTYSKFGPGTMVFKNNGQVGDEWFSLSDSLLTTFIDFGTSSVTTNLFISRIDIPIIYDYDLDGDLDIFSFNITGFQLEFYKNFSIENGLGCNFDFELKNQCWGYFGESLEENTIVLGQDCSNVANPERSATGGGRHSGSTLLMLDIDGNGEQDVVMGDVSFNRLTSLLNGGPSTDTGLDSIVDVNYQFPDTINPGGMNTFPGAYYEDVNNDQLKDLIVAPNAQFIADNSNSIKMYLNSGANDHPVFDFQTGSFLQGDMIDVGEGAYPVLIDVNRDGLTDLLIGNRKRTIDSVTVSAITYYKNTGTAELPQFELVTRDYFEISHLNIGQALFPAFMDLNGDDATDMILGNLTGNLYYLINRAAPDQPFDFSGPPFELTDNEGSIIDVGQLAKPQAVDLNNDFLKDLAVGSRGGNIIYFENTGNQSTPEFTWKTDSLGHIKAPGYLSNTGNAAPFFYRENGQIKLLMGSETGELFYYTSIINNLDGTFEEITGPATGIREGMRSVPARGDLNNDQLPDLMLGNYRGGLSFFIGDSLNPDTGVVEKVDVLIYPNPAYDQLTIIVLSADEFDVNIFNSVGQFIYSEKHKNNSKALINVSGWASGSYVVEVKYNEKRYVYHLIIVNK